MAPLGTLVAICMAARLSPLPHLRKKQKWLSANFYDFTGPNVWPPNSPDLNPMDYYVWGAVEKDSSRCARTTKPQLIERIKAAFEALSWEIVKSACSRFRSRIEAAIDANDGYFE